MRNDFLCVISAIFVGISSVGFCFSIIALFALWMIGHIDFDFMTFSFFVSFLGFGFVSTSGMILMKEQKYFLIISVSLISSVPYIYLLLLNLFEKAVNH